MAFSTARLLILFVHVALALSANVSFVFNITNAVVAPDGFPRAGVIVNSQFPGTLIQANKTDRLNIDVRNFLTNPEMRRSTSIHWHGLFQMRTATEDGPAFVNQCPIPPAPTTPHHYQYSFPLRGQAGTFWYHSHLSTQYADGLRGALIVYDPEDPHLHRYDIDDAGTVITLDEWYHRPAIPITDRYITGEPNNHGHHEPAPASGLINGKGRFIGGPEIPWARVNVVKGKRYRFRIINSSAYARFTFSIAGHRMTIIEVDGISHQPLTVDSFEIHVAQRYSVVVEANQPVDNYWIRGPMTLKHASDNPKLDEKNVFAVLHYDGAPDADPTAPKGQANGVELEEFRLKPLDPGPPGGAGPADHVIDLKFGTTKDAQDNFEWEINGISYKSPDLPTLLEILNGARNMNDFNRSEHTFVLKRNEVVELHIHGSAVGHIHPFHLHGHAFDIIKSMKGPLNFVDPPRRDVVGVGGSEVIIRFRADNPGPWFLHCHIDWHLEAGLAVVFAEDPEGIVEGPKSVIIPPAWLDLCPAYKALPPALQ